MGTTIVKHGDWSAIIMNFSRCVLATVVTVLLFAVSKAHNDNDPHFLGCFHRSPEDSLDPPRYLDPTCTFATAPHCRSGLPFYRLPLQEGQSFLDCLSFCSSKGLDRAGIVTPEHECRCGASQRHDVFANKKAEQKLLLPPGTPPGMADRSNCTVLVWERNSSKSGGEGPFLSAKDLAYIDSIVEGRDVFSRSGCG